MAAPQSTGTATKWISAREAAQILEVSLATLYTYVSRGLLHPKADPGARRKHYPLVEVERLKHHNEGARQSRSVARATLDFGLPVLESALCLIEHGRIQTTLAKAKALRPFVEKMITKAKHAAAKTEKKDQLHLRRLVMADIRNEDAVTKLFNETHKDFANRSGGYTRIYKLGPQRISDAAELALIEFVKADEQGYKKSKGGKKAKSKKAPKKSEAATTEAAPAAEAPKSE